MKLSNTSTSTRKSSVDERLAYSVDDAAQAVGLGKSTLYREMAEGRLRYRKVGDRRLILKDDLLAWLSSGREAA
jgi:excisionase family DNA binding protein